MKCLVYFFLFISFPIALHAQCTGTDVGGTVYLDIPVSGAVANLYGVKDANEPGLENITVTLFDANGGTMTTLTDAVGEWVFSNPNFPVRIEFSWTQSWLTNSSSGAALPNTSVRWVNANDCAVNLGLQNPNDYSNTPLPNYVTNLRVAGATAGSTIASLQTTTYTNVNMNSDFTNADGNTGTGTPPTDDANISQIGATWGKAYQKSKERMFLASVLWRHVDFAPSTGLGDFFVLDYASSPVSLTGNVDLQGVVPTNGGPAIDFGSVCRNASCAGDVGHTGFAADYEITGNPNIDLDAYTKVGKVGMGGMAMDNLTETVWLINLNQKGIVAIEASGNLASMSSRARQYLIESLPGAPTCTNGNLRPWAIKTFRGKGYLGVVCDGITSQTTDDMDAYILSFDLVNPAAGFTTEYTFPLNYDKDGLDWNAWQETYNPNNGGYWKDYTQPILSDIDFDELGNMYISFIDRFGLQAGLNQTTPVSQATNIDEKTLAMGELFKICNTAGTWELEGTGSCPVNYLAFNEFFNDRAGDGQQEGAGGALAILPGSNQLLLQQMDPHPEGSVGQTYWTSQGVNTLSTTNGAIENWYAHVYAGSPYNGKGVGMGDIELLTDHAPLEIGNLVWFDKDKDGVQDPGESGISGVEVVLFDDSNNVIATATTDANGQYIFSSEPSGTNTASHIYGLAALSPNQDYTLRILNATGGSQQTPLTGMDIASTDTGEGAHPNLNDSDASLTGNTTQIAIFGAHIPIYGANNYSMDFGFIAGCPASLCLPITAVKK